MEPKESEEIRAADPLKRKSKAQIVRFQDLHRSKNINGFILQFHRIPKEIMFNYHPYLQHMKFVLPFYRF